MPHAGILAIRGKCNWTNVPWGIVPHEIVPQKSEVLPMIGRKSGMVKGMVKFRLLLNRMPADAWRAANSKSRENARMNQFLRFMENKDIMFSSHFTDPTCAGWLDYSKAGIGRQL